MRTFSLDLVRTLGVVSSFAFFHAYLLESQYFRLRAKRLTRREGILRTTNLSSVEILLHLRPLTTERDTEITELTQLYDLCLLYTSDAADE